MTLDQILDKAAEEYVGSNEKRKDTIDKEKYNQLINFYIKYSENILAHSDRDKLVNKMKSTSMPEFRAKMIKFRNMTYRILRQVYFSEHFDIEDIEIELIHKPNEPKKKSLFNKYSEIDVIKNTKIKYKFYDFTELIQARITYLIENTNILRDSRTLDIHIYRCPNKIAHDDDFDKVIACIFHVCMMG